MSISDKLTAIAENEKKVFTAGKRALLKASKHLNATASGQTVTMNDVSPLTGEVAVTLSSNIVTDFSQVTVKRYGKNLLPSAYPIKYWNNYGITCTQSGDGSLTLNGKATAVATFNLYGNGTGLNATPFTDAFADGERYCISCGVTLPEGVGIGNYFYNEDGVIKSGAHINAGAKSNSFSKSVDRVRLYSHIRIEKDTVLDNFTLYPMIEKGSPATEYEPYAEPTVYAASADGALAVPTVSSVMTLATEADGVTLNCAYLRDIDIYIDSLIGGA